MKINKKLTIENVMKKMNSRVSDYAEEIIVNLKDKYYSPSLLVFALDQIACKVITRNSQKWELIRAYVAIEDFGSKSWGDVMCDFIDDIFSKIIFEGNI